MHKRKARRKCNLVIVFAGDCNVAWSSRT